MVVAYLRERFPLRLYAPLAALSAYAPFPQTDRWLTVVADGVFALLLLLQFRTWDDLADRSRDAQIHPSRVLVRAPQVTLVIAFCGALAVLNLCLTVWRDASGIALAVLAALNGTLGAWYLSRDAASGLSADSLTRRAIGDHLVLAKYPAIVVIVAGERTLDLPLRIGLTAAALYAAACVYEAWHDPGGPLARRYAAWAKHPLGGR